MAGPCIHLNNGPLLSLLLAKLASSASPQKPPVTYTTARLILGSMILDHIRTRFLGGDLYARVTYTRVYTVCDIDLPDIQVSNSCSKSTIVNSA